MKKFILVVALTIVSASVLTSVVSARPQDDGKSKAAVVADSVGAKTARITEKVVEGALMVADSATVKGKRFGEKAAAKADSIRQRGKRAWRVFTGKDQKETQENDSISD